MQIRLNMISLRRLGGCDQKLSYSLRRYTVGQCWSPQTRRQWLLCPSVSSRHFSYEAAITGVWKSLSASAPVACVQEGLTNFHDFTGMPWWLTIVCSTFVLRSAVTLPLAVYQNKIMARIELIALEMPPIVNQLKRETAYAMKKFDWTEKHARVMYNKSIRKQYNDLIVRDNCHPGKTMIVVWAQLPLWIMQSVAIRNIVHMLPDPSRLEAKITFTELTLGGFLWMPNLTEIDSSYILPVALGLVNLVIIEIQTLNRQRAPTKMQKYATNFFRGLSIVMVPIAASVPSCLALYWLSSSCFGLAQNLSLMSPSVRRVFGIPQTNSELAHPYKNMIESANQRIKCLTQRSSTSEH